MVKCEWCGEVVDSDYIVDVSGDQVCQECHQEYLDDEKMNREDPYIDAMETKYEMLRDN